MRSEFLPFTKPAINNADIEAVCEVLRSGWITNGPQNAALETGVCEVTGNRYGVALSSATAAMHLLMKIMPIAQRRAEQYARNFADLRKFLERNAGQQVMILSFDRKEDLEPLARAAAELGLAINVEAPDFSERNFDVMESKSRRRSVWTPRLPLKAEENRK